MHPFFHGGDVAELPARRGKRIARSHAGLEIPVDFVFYVSIDFPCEIFITFSAVPETPPAHAGPSTRVMARTSCSHRFRSWRSFFRPAGVMR